MRKIYMMITLLVLLLASATAAMAQEGETPTVCVGETCYPVDYIDIDDEKVCASAEVTGTIRICRDATDEDMAFFFGGDDEAEVTEEVSEDPFAPLWNATEENPFVVTSEADRELALDFQSTFATLEAESFPYLQWENALILCDTLGMATEVWVVNESLLYVECNNDEGAFSVLPINPDVVVEAEPAGTNVDSPVMLDGEIDFVDQFGEEEETVSFSFEAWDEVLFTGIPSGHEYVVTVEGIELSQLAMAGGNGNVFLASEINGWIEIGSGILGFAATDDVAGNPVVTVTLTPR
jgi:hypothetical protein